MIEVPSLDGWFPSGVPGPVALAEHVRATGNGRWWADREAAPRAVAVACADHVLLEGDPRYVDPDALAPLANGYVLARTRFLPVLGAAFERVVPGERMIWVQSRPVPRRRPPRDAVVRRLAPGDGPAVAAAGDDVRWITRSWGGAQGLAASGHAWGAFRSGRLVSLACTYFLGDRYEDLAVVTLRGHRREGLALACLSGLCGDVASRGRTPGWTCSRGNRPSRRLAWTAGFRLFGEYVHYAVGRPAGAGRLRGTTRALGAR
ncbi:GNAT family N-acetyltransferase [Actinacidiphila glaucinigra]|uniref:GNAT family N-acetyltransferase n=1 Tax=Actinacidiphila glaucinigra TaxID=235986 RepID=UPI0037C7627E